MLDARKEEAFCTILREELQLATGCTEPIAVAYCAARLRQVLGERPRRILAEVSGNILKNVKSVVVPNTGGRRGLPAAIAVGANLLVNNGTLIAQGLGVPESVIALTFVALGTSLPELVTAITSLVKGHSALSLGNIVGANLFNLVLVSGLSTTLSPFQVPQEKTIAGYNASLVVDIPLMMLVMLLLTVPALAKGRLSRWQGIVLLVLYAGFCAFQFCM